METRSVPKITASTFTILRPADGRTLTAADVQRTRWSLIPGGRAVVALYAFRTAGGAAEALGRVLADQRVGEVVIQSSMAGADLAEFQRAVTVSARHFAEAMAGDLR